MFKPSDAPTNRRAGAYCGSALLDSSLQRFVRVLIVVALMWALTSWAMDWW